MEPWYKIALPRKEVRKGRSFQTGIDFSVSIDGPQAKNFEADLNQILEDLGLGGRILIP